MIRVVVLEGINAAGKSSVGALVECALQKVGHRCLRVDPAGFGPLGQSLRERIVQPQFEGNPELDAILFTALRAEGAKKVLDVASSEQQTFVLLERWSLALSAYGAVDGARPELIRELRIVLAQILRVDLTVLLDVGGQMAFDRISRTASHNRFEMRGAGYLERVASAYRFFAHQESGTAVVDASRSPESTCEAVCRQLAARWGDLVGIGQALS